MRPRKGARRASAIFGTITSLLFYSFFAFLGWMGMLFFSLPDQTVWFVPALCWILMFVMLYWQLTPILAASFGASLDLRKLLSYPIPHSKLFLVEVVLRVATCFEMFILVAGPMAGLLRNPRFGWGAAPGILAGGIAFIAINILLSAGARNLLERLFLRSRLKEALMFLVVFSAVMPQILMLLHVKKEFFLRMAPTQVIWPWGAMAHVMLRDSVGLSLLSAAVWVGAAA